MPPKKNALSTVVDDLVRASLGKSGSIIETDDLDKYVADLILKEAEEKRKKYNSIGVRAYQPDTGLPPNNLPKPNKRFLLNMVKATDSHNKHVIRSNEEKVAKLRRERLDRERSRREQDEKHGRHSRRSRSRSRSKSRSPDRKRSRLHRRPSHSLDSPKDKPRDAPKKEEIQYRGRGKVKMAGSSMDKYFEKDYDPERDIESDLEEYVYTETLDTEVKEKKDRKSKKDKKKDKKDKKDHDKKKKKKKKHREEEKSEKPKPTRAWDVGK